MPPLGTDDAADLQAVLDGLDDEGCRRIVEALDEPVTAKELSEACDIPLSTVYRKLELLTDAALLGERAVLQPDGHHTTEYHRVFEEVVVHLDDDETLDVELARSVETRNERLETLWAEVRKEI